ncbi:hypothetical protein PoB_007546400 [Plakobranchus ocellatus]|uniref:Uncharacterized protein n=1 Tax=Plakobranchus ocellatus TaxID=259542 RepID=A0AAV4DY27_9GAST|nr:hypothetical protein PoB_007546400 [Plakobranchus ocellatus]
MLKTLASRTAKSSGTRLNVDTQGIPGALSEFPAGREPLRRAPACFYGQYCTLSSILSQKKPSKSFYPTRSEVFSLHYRLPLPNGARTCPVSILNQTPMDVPGLERSGVEAAGSAGFGSGGQTKTELLACQCHEAVDWSQPQALPNNPLSSNARQ